MAGKELKGREKVVSKMTRDGLTEENLADGSVKDISHKSRGRPLEMKQDFVFDREKKKDKLSDGQSEERNLQKKQIRNSSLRKEAISEEPILEESVLDGEGAGEKNVSEKSPQYKKKFREHAQIPEDDSLTGQKKKIRKKQIQKQMRKEQAKSGRLSFDDEENQMVKGPGMKPGRTIGRYAVRDAISKGVSDSEEEEQDVATETVQFAERGTETAVRGLRYAQLRSQRADVKANRRGYHLDETGEKLKFGMSDSMGKAGAEETVKRSEEKKRVLNRFFQRKRYKDAYRAARTGKTAGSAGGAATVAGVENITVKAKIALKEIVMNGVEYTVEDTGAFARYGVQFDVYYDNHSAASAHGHKTWEAFIADSNGSNEVTVTNTTTKKILYVTLGNTGFDAVARANLNEEQMILYNALNTTYGNRNYLWDIGNISTGSGSDGMSYEIPPEALQDEEFARMIREAEKYLGVPYVWGGYSPSGFDCSGFVSYVINHCGNGWNLGRQTAEGLRNSCTFVSPGDAKPGDLIFFQGTYSTPGASHVGIYVGNNMMIHCGDPIHYSNIGTAYWQQHFMCFGRLP